MSTWDDKPNDYAHALEIIEQLRAEIALWKDRYEAERRDHEATIKHADRIKDEWSA